MHLANALIRRMRGNFRKFKLRKMKTAPQRRAVGTAERREARRKITKRHQTNRRDATDALPHDSGRCTPRLLYAISAGSRFGSGHCGVDGGVGAGFRFFVRSISLTCRNRIAVNLISRRNLKSMQYPSVFKTFPL